MTPTPEELRQLANEMTTTMGTRLNLAAIEKLRACADLLERSPKVTDDVVTHVIHAYDSMSFAGRIPNDAMCSALKDVWPVPDARLQGLAEKWRRLAEKPYAGAITKDARECWDAVLRACADELLALLGND